MDNPAYRPQPKRHDVATQVDSKDEEYVDDDELKKIEENRYGDYAEVQEAKSSRNKQPKTRRVSAEPATIKISDFNTFKSTTSEISQVIRDLEVFRDYNFKQQAMKLGFMPVPKRKAPLSEPPNQSERTKSTFSQSEVQYEPYQALSSFTSAAKRADQLAIQDLRKHAAENGYHLIPIKDANPNNNTSSESKYYPLYVGNLMSPINEEVEARSSKTSYNLPVPSLPPSFPSESLENGENTENRKNSKNGETVIAEANQPTVTKNSQGRIISNVFEHTKLIIILLILLFFGAIWLLITAMFFMGCISLVICTDWVDTSGGSGFRYDRISIWAITFSISMSARFSASMYLYYNYKRFFITRPSYFIIIEIPCLVYLCVSFIAGCVLSYGSMGYLFQRGIVGFCGLYYSGIFLVISLIWLLLLFVSPPVIHRVIKNFQ